MAKKNSLSWLWVGLCILAIFLLAPTARSLQEALVSLGGRGLIGLLVLAGVLLGLGAAFNHVYFRLKIRSASRLFWLFAAAAVFAGYALLHRDAPEEAVHFLEYGFLGFLLFRALRPTIRDRTVYPTVLFAGILVGIFDEILQWILPSRLWDLRDVGLNAAAVGIVLLAVLLGLRPQEVKGKVKARSVKVCSLLLAANFLLLGLCLSNTPERVERYTRFLTPLSFLQKEEPMYERRIKHRDPEIGVFTSRLTVDWLEKTDLMKSAEYIRILREWKDREVGDFLKTFNAAQYPFLYEFRVHAFRRDRHLDKAASASSIEGRTKALFIAVKEHLILMKYFGRTLEGSVHSWEEKDFRVAEAAVDKAAPYKSPVSAGPLGAMSETFLWVTILSLLILLTGWNVILTVKKVRKWKGSRPSP